MGNNQEVDDFSSGAPAKAMTEPGATVDKLEALARPLIESGRPDLLGLHPATMDWTTFRRRPWALLAVAAALIASDPRDPEALATIRSAERGFRYANDAEGLGYAAYVDGTRWLGLGEHREAASRWRDVRECLGDRSPVSTNALAHLSLAAYHAGAPMEAAAVADEAVGLARIRLDRRGEGRALVYRSLADLALGDLDRCWAASVAADVAFAETEEAVSLFEWPLVPLGRVAVHGFRGEYEAGQLEACEALSRARRVGIVWYQGIALAMRAEFCAPADPPKAVADARRALELLRATGDQWWENAALRALGSATALAGHPSGAVRLLEEAITSSPSPFENARCCLALAEVLVANGQISDAQPLLHHSRTVFHEAGAKLVLCQTLRLLAATSPERAPTFRAEAGAMATDDAAYDRVLDTGWPEAAVRITVRCMEPLSVAIDGEELSFMTENARRALFILALSGSAGLHQEELSEHLWPGAPATRVGQRLRTLLWQVRKALGSEAWRLERRGSVVVLNPINVEVDLLRALEVAQRLTSGAPTPEISPWQVQELTGELEGPLLTRYRYEEWTQGWRDQAKLTVQLLRRLRPPPTLGPEPRRVTP